MQADVGLTRLELLLRDRLQQVATKMENGTKYSKEMKSSRKIQVDFLRMEKNKLFQDHQIQTSRT